MEISKVDTPAGGLEMGGRSVMSENPVVSKVTIPFEGLRASTNVRLQTFTKSFPIPLKNQNQAVLSFSKLPADRSDFDLLKNMD